jgi:protease IV
MDSNDAPPPIPPPASAPPLITPPPRPPERRRGKGWMVFAIVVLVLLIVSLLANFTQFLGSATSLSGAHGHTAGPKLDEVTYEDNDAESKIALVDVSGVITGGAADQSGYSLADVIKAQLKRAKEDDKVKAVILRVDSPGGEVLAADQINREIIDFQESSKKPVIASMGSLAASGGYYVSAPCRWIVANEMTITGSIGVIMDTFNYRGLMDKVGVSPVVYKSGRFKDMLSGTRSTNEIPPEENALVQSLINEIYGKFKNVVQDGRDSAHALNKGAIDADARGRALSTDWKDYADGRVVSGSEALRLGFVDELGDFEAAVKRTEKLAGITNANLIVYEERRDLSDIFRIFGQSQTRTIKVDLGMDLPKMQAGQLYFLAPTFLH